MKHVCKFCKKSFPCGRSLGGHMRSHMTNNKSSATAIDESKTKQSNTRVVSSSGTTATATTTNNNTNYMYGLRENPKKTWRLISDSNQSILDGSNSNSSSRLCKECGKGFQSWKALFGHMRCHSEKDKEKVSNNHSNNCLEDDSWTTAQSDNEAPKKRRRSKRSVSRRYNRTNTTATTATTTTVTTNSSSFSYANNGSVSKIEQEQEEVAMCLMMLSRDVGNWGGFMINTVAESSDNNSVVVVEGRSNGDCRGHRSIEMKILRENKLESEFGGSNFGGFRSGCFKKFDSEVSVDGIKRCLEDCETGIDVCDAQLGGKVKCSEDQVFESESDDDDDDKCDLRKKVISYYSPFDLQIGGEFGKKMRSNEASDSGKKSKFECTTCNKVFHSYQALGGHRASHKKTKGCSNASKIEGSENSIEVEIVASPDRIEEDDIKLIKSSDQECPIGGGGRAKASHVSKKSKHECPVCFKVFSSGQALGGHKRSHMVDGAEARANHSIIIQQKLPAIRDLLDLNLPAPIDEDNNGHIGLKPWWIGSNPKHEPVAAGLIS
ncbi:hypothetical protein Syun_023345 [Stephania yunnanensis]|uniref:C2H2-type domain-containing protein n=1 Tax=Stephania yunnanensis TaxID=152371 RepID=A0AAP0FNQ6_9MAGN